MDGEASKSKQTTPGRTSKATKSIKFSDTVSQLQDGDRMTQIQPNNNDSVNVLAPVSRALTKLELAMAKSRSESIGVHPSRMNLDLSRYDNTSVSDLTLDVRPRIKNIIEELHREHEWAWPPEPGRDVPRLRFFKRKKNKMFYSLEFLDFCTFLSLIIGPLELLVAVGFAVVPKTFILAMRESVEITGLVIVVFLFQGFFHVYAAILGLALRASKPFEIGYIYPNWALEVVMPLLGIFSVFASMYMTQDWMVEREMILHLKGYNFHWYSKGMWDSYQSFMSCCGINSFNDWNYHGPLMYNEKQGRVFAVPNSCCLVSNCSSHPTINNVMTSGCLERTLSIMSAIYVVAIICVIFSIILLCMGHRSVNEAGGYSGDPIHKLLFDDRYSKKRMYSRSNRRAELFDLLNYYCMILGKELGFDEEVKDAQAEEDGRSKLEGDMDTDKDRYEPPDDYAGKSPPNPVSYDNLRDDLHFMPDPNDTTDKEPKFLPKPQGSALNKGRWNRNQDQTQAEDKEATEPLDLPQQPLKLPTVPLGVKPVTPTEAHWQSSNTAKSDALPFQTVTNAKILKLPITEIVAGYTASGQFALTPPMPAPAQSPTIKVDVKTELFSSPPMHTTRPMSKLVDGPSSDSGSGSVVPLASLADAPAPDSFHRVFEAEANISGANNRLNPQPSYRAPDINIIATELAQTQEQEQILPIAKEETDPQVKPVPVSVSQVNDPSKLASNASSKSKLATVLVEPKKSLSEVGGDLFGIEFQKTHDLVESAADMDSNTVPAEATSTSFNIFSNFGLPKIPPEYLKAAFLAAQDQLRYLNDTWLPKADLAENQGSQNESHNAEPSISETDPHQESIPKDSYAYAQQVKKENKLLSEAVAATSQRTSFVDHLNDPVQGLEDELKKSKESDGSTPISTTRDEEKKVIVRKSGIPSFAVSANAPPNGANDKQGQDEGGQGTESGSSARTSRRPRSIPVFMSKVNPPKRVGEKSNVTREIKVMETIPEDPDPEKSESNNMKFVVGPGPSNQMGGSRTNRASQSNRSGSANPNSSRR